MTSTDPMDWVASRSTVELRYASDGGVHAVGRVIAYTDRPTVTILTVSGDRVSWIADLCRPVEGGDTTP